MAAKIRVANRVQMMIREESLQGIGSARAIAKLCEEHLAGG